MSKITAIKVKNFRVFNDWQNFEISPLTLFTGPNNSGKSSLIKLLSLLKVSAGSREKLDRLTFNKVHDLLNFNSCLNTKEKGLSIGTNLDLLEGQIKYEIELIYLDNEVESLTGSKSPYLASIHLNYKNKNVLKIEFLQRKESQNQHELTRDIFKYDMNIEILNDFLKDINAAYKQKGKENAELFAGIGLVGMENKYEDYLFLEENLVFIIPKRTIENFHSPHRDYDLTLLTTLQFISENFSMRDDCDKEASREILQDLKRFTNEFLIGGIEIFSKELLNVYFSSISSRQFHTRVINFNDNALGSMIAEYADLNEYRKKSLTTKIGSFLTKLEIGFDTIDINFDADFQVSRIFLGLANGIDVKRDLADLGFGIKQVISILLFIALTEEKQNDEDIGDWIPSIMVLEEPETNLHPNLQSKLFDLIADAAKTYNMRFIIETHSPFIIRRIQYQRIAKQLNREDVRIYYFDIVDENNSKVNLINIKDNGLLDPDFGKGFLDEETQQKIAIMSIKTTNLN